MSHHTSFSKAPCPSCEEKLAMAHPELSSWFREKVKPTFPDAHISWSYRDQISQEEAYDNKRTKLHFPYSAHNKMPALALDLFEINPDTGEGVWNPRFFIAVKKIAPQNVIWGGVWKALGDNDHFELLPDPPEPPKSAA